MKSDFMDNSTAAIPVNNYKPVMTVNLSDSDSEKPTTKSKFLRVLKKILVFFLWLVILTVIFISSAAFLLFGIPKIQDRTLSAIAFSGFTNSREDALSSVADEIATSEKKIAAYNKQLMLLIPKTPYIIINTTDNEFTLYADDKVIRTGKCSTGKNTILQKTEQKKWVFKTPRGAMRVRGKITNPVWVKPDWAFIEEGLPVPGATHPSRYESGTLGDYAMSLGDGYMIHGTLYKRLLGMPVTHGCIRMNDEDLEVVYNTLIIGSKVYIY